MNSYYSNIYWHFTGSPKGLDWTKIYCPNDIIKFGKPKPEHECVSILSNIIRSKKLLAIAREKIDTHIYSDPFCCVTDIPIQNLHDHKEYYGNVAIGFKHTIVQKQFNPVFYISKDLLPKKPRLYEELTQEEKFLYSIFRLKSKGSAKGNAGYLNRLKNGLSVDENKLGPILFHHFKITTFSENPADTFYREREWRRLDNFDFEFNHIAAIIASGESLEKIQSMLLEYKISDVPVLTWEILDRM